MILPSGAYCLFRERYVSATKDQPQYARPMRPDEYDPCAPVAMVVHSAAPVAVAENVSMIPCTAEEPGATPIPFLPPSHPSMQLGEHHWVTLIAEYWDSQADFDAGKPSVLIADHHFGHRCVMSDPNLIDCLTRVVDEHYRGGLRGPRHLDRKRPPKTNDVLGLLNHPHVAALEVTP